MFVMLISNNTGFMYVCNKHTHKPKNYLVNITAICVKQGIV